MSKNRIKGSTAGSSSDILNISGHYIMLITGYTILMHWNVAVLTTVFIVINASRA